MLAPRKKLWSSPDAAVESALKLLSPTKDDIVYDVGCGDGRFLIKCALTIGCKCVGIEIDEKRAMDATEKIQAAGVSHLVTIRIGNALEIDFSEATAMFLYLVPRGLRIILPLLQESPQKRRIVTYMAGFEGIKPLAVEKITPEHQPDARWPVFLFELGGDQDAIAEGECRRTPQGARTRTAWKTERTRANSGPISTGDLDCFFIRGLRALVISGALMAAVVVLHKTRSHK